jgi:hypothetical protein
MFTHTHIYICIYIYIILDNYNKVQLQKHLSCECLSKATLAAYSNTSRTPSRVFAEHSR